MAENAAIEHAVREFLTDNFPLSGDATELDRDESLIGAGVIDSTGVLEVIGFVEERYEIQIADEEVLPAFDPHLAEGADLLQAHKPIEDDSSSQ